MIMLDWAIALMASAGAAFLMLTLWNRGVLDNPRVRVAIPIGLMIGWVFLGLLKKWQLDVSLTYGICRRLGDVSWWGIVIGTVACGLAATGTIYPVTRSGRKARRAWIMSVGITVTAYLLLVYFPRETFFFDAPWSSKAKWIQTIEGATMVVWILACYFYLIQVTTALATLGGLSSTGKRRFRLLVPLWIYSSIPVVLLTVIGLWSGFDNICRDCPGWKDEPPHWDKIFWQVLFLWWPLFFLPLWWIPAVAKWWEK